MANPQVETVHSGADKAKLTFAILLAVAGFVVFYILSARGMAGWMQWGVLLVLLVLAAGVFTTTSWGKEFIAYCRDTVKELKKVYWPTPKEAMQMTLYVFVFVLVMALFLWGADALMNLVIYKLILGWN